MRGHPAARLATSTWALSLALTALAIALLALNLSQPNVPLYDYWIHSTAIAVAFSTVGAMIASRRPGHPVGWLFCAIGVLVGIDHLCAEYATYALLAQPDSLPAGEAAAWIRSWIWIVSGGLGVLLVLLFPDGRLASGRWRYLVWLNVALTVLGSAAVALSPGPVDALAPTIRNPLGMEALGIPLGKAVVGSIEVLQIFVALIAATSPFVRLRRARFNERQQIKWFAYATTILIVGALASSLGQGAWNGWLWRLGFALYIAGIAGLPVAVGIAILRYRLFDIDLVINRTLVYGALTGSVAGLYALVVGGLGALANARGNPAVALLATGLVAVLFQPLRNRLQRSVNRLMYGERDDPRGVLARLGRRLEETPNPEEVLSAIVDTVARALKLPYVAITLKHNGTFETAAARGSLPDDPTTIPLVYQRETVGQLVLATRSPGESFAPADSRLLEDLARHAEVAVQAVRLTADLRRSRERLVAAREEERRRLRRDLHDGLGPALGGLTLGLDAARGMLTKDPSYTDGLLADLRDQAQETVADVGRLVYGLRPPALDDLGIVPAIRQQAARHGVLVDKLPARPDHQDLEAPQTLFFVEASGDLSRIPAAVEVACYRIAQEAMVNVARHARASSCRVRFSVHEVDKTLDLEVVDDGVGVPEDRRAGVGMNSMRERAEELGGTLTVEHKPEGGTRIVATLPLLGKETL